MLKKINRWFKGWPKSYKTWFLIVLVGFWIWGIARGVSLGNRHNDATDGTSEILTIFAAKHFVEHGFSKNYFLPTYPPYGPDSSGKPHTKPFVYTHYLPGQAYVLGIIYKIFGTDKAWIGRIISHTLSVLALAFLCFQFARFTKSPLMGCLFLTMMMLPRSFTYWTIGLNGQSYIMAFYILLFGYVIRMSIVKEKRPWVAWSVGGGAGFLQMYFGFDFVPLTFIAILGFIALLPKLDKNMGKILFISFFVGSCAAALLQFIFCAFYFGGAMNALNDFIHWGTWRASGEGPVGIKNPKDLYLNRILRMYHKQTYGATGFHAVQLLGLSAFALLLGYWAKFKTKVDLKRGFAAIVFIYLAAICWTVIMRQHSHIHVFFIHRHYSILYINFLFIALPIFYELVQRAKYAPKKI